MHIRKFIQLKKKPYSSLKHPAKFLNQIILINYGLSEQQQHKQQAKIINE